MDDKADKIKAIADFTEEMVELSPEELGDEKIYLKAAQAVLENQPRIWQDALIYLRMVNRKINHLDNLELIDGRIAFCAYAAKYQLENGQKDLMELFAEFYNSEQATIIDVKDLDNFDSFFEYPRRIEFTPEAHEEIIRRILNDEMSDDQIDLYLGAEESSRFGYSKLYPALKHILQTTTNAHLFWTAGDVLAIIWRLLPDSDKELDSWFNQELHDIFWPRANAKGLQLLTSEKIIANDSLDWVVNNPDCKALEPKLWKRLEQLAEDKKLGPDDVNLPAVFGQVCNIRTEKMSPAEKFDFVAQYYDDEELYGFFCRPETTEEARVYIEKAFDEYKFTPEECQEIIWNDDDPRRNYWLKTVRALEMLLAEPLEPKVQEYVLQYVVDHFSSTYASNHSVSAMRLLWAACNGAVKPSAARKALAEKCREVLVQDAKDTTPVDTALELAQEMVDFRTFQETDLVKNLRRYGQK